MSNDYDPANVTRLPLEWLKPVTKRSTTSRKNGTEIDDSAADDDMLPSFVDLQRKTIRTLYGDGDGSDDKSPKGSVDGPIRPLVDLINKHSCFCTLSSCSGRISLFDPNGRHSAASETETTNSNSRDSKETPGSGKGAGGWLLVSHHPIQPNELVECFSTRNQNQQETNCDETANVTIMPWILKFEPMLLHVAASSLRRGKELLQLSLELGFRESGLVVSDSRVTVAIRTHSLALGIPLSPSGPLRPNEKFLNGLLDEANQRLIKNWNQLDRLYERIESKLFEIDSVPQIRASQIPPLNLWNVGAAAVTLYDDRDGVDRQDLNIWVFGGYGIGPNKEVGQSSCCRRSNQIYKLQRRNNQWNSEWQQITCVAPTKETTLNGYNVTWVPKLPECQGMVACYMPSNKCIALWGGRVSPKQALQDLYLFDPVREPSCMAVPNNVQGTPPSPRWGHSFVKINERTLMVAGGCNIEQGALDDIFLLHIVGESSFCWERLSITLPSPLFHHTAIVKDDTVIILGGLQSTTKVLEPFEMYPHENNNVLWAFTLDESHQNEDGLFLTNARVIQSFQNNSNSLASLKRFGGSACNIDSLTLVSGGLICSDNSEPSPLESIFISFDQGKIRARRLPNIIPNDEDLDFGSLVHHSCLAIGGSEFILLGGGVTSFAFGNSFAKYVKENTQKNVPLGLENRLTFLRLLFSVV